MPERLDAASIRRWCDAGLAALCRYRDRIDNLNVFPVPDGDTGTNLLMTARAAAQALNAGSTDRDGGPANSEGADQALLRLARGALLGARGNSGVILAQFFRGFADALVGVENADGHDLAKAFDQARAAAYRAVSMPVEGTILTVAAQAATAAGEIASNSVLAVAEAAARAARAALARTPRQLPDLARAGVLDAGGYGLTVLLNALVEALGGRGEPPVEDVPRAECLAAVPRETGSSRFDYEVQYLLEADQDSVRDLRVRLCELGDSVAIVGGTGLGGDLPTWNVHVHANDVGGAVEAGVEAGRPFRIHVTRFDDLTLDESGPDPGGTVAQGARAIVVLCDGPGLGPVFAQAGAAVAPLRDGRPQASEILRAVSDCGAERVVILPNTAPALLVDVVGAVREIGVRTTVVPTRSPVQALSALAVHDSSRDFDDDVIAMAEAAGACRHAAVIRAPAEALTVVGHCQEGDILAMVEGEVNLIGQDILAVGRDLLDRLLSGGGELVTLVTGVGAPPDLVDALSAHLRQHWPFVETQWYVGGQPGSPLLIGVD